MVFQFICCAVSSARATKAESHDAVASDWCDDACCKHTCEANMPRSLQKNNNETKTRTISLKSRKNNIKLASKKINEHAQI